MSTPRQRDIVIVPFPFTDLSGKKVRPVLILSNDAYNRRAADVLVCSLTSRLSPTPYSVLIGPNDVEQPETITQTGKIRADRISSLHQSLIIRSIARLKKPVFARVIAEIVRLVNV